MKPRFATTAAKRRTRQSFDFRLPVRAQLALLTLPAVRNQLAMERRLFLVTLCDHLQGKISQNAFAGLAGVPSSSLSQWRKAFQRRGVNGLLNQSFGRKPKRRLPAPCSLTFALKT